MEKLERQINWEPAYDKRNKDPKKNYGIHGMSIRFLLKGKKGVVQFLIYTNWHMEHVREETSKQAHSGTLDPLTAYVMLAPMAADIGYHAHVPQYKGQEPMDGTCEYFDNKSQCYYDGSSLRAETFFTILVEKGIEELWKAMEKDYESISPTPVTE